MATRWQITDQAGVATASQTTVLDTWHDGSVRWLLVEFQANQAAGESGAYTLEEAHASIAQEAMVVALAGQPITVSSGAATFNLPVSGDGFLDSVIVDGRPILKSTSISAEDAQGTRHAFTVESATLIHNGPVRATVRLDGTFGRSGGQPWLNGAVQLTFHSGHGTIDTEFTVTNPRAAQHPGGTWDLGDPGSVLIRHLALTVESNCGSDQPISCSLDGDDRLAPASPRLSVYQDSSGGVNWQHINHANREGRVAATFRGFRAERAGNRIEGLRATPIVGIGGGAEQISIAVPRFWQMCPKSISVEGGRCVLGMLPGEYGDLHELQGGERTTLRFSLCFGRDIVSAVPLAWVRDPLSVSADPASYQQAGAWSPFAVGSPSAIADYEAIVDAAVTGDRTFADRREVIDEYGWRNFGDLFADHEAVRQPLVSHYNNQYDALAGFLFRYLETADSRWRVMADDLALHVADIDLYHTDLDRSAYSGGHFWHTQHYQPAGTATHRAYSRRSGSSGGGPSAEHNYTTGLMLHFFLTGTERSRAAVIQLADWVINMDDGTKSILRWLDNGDTGLASGTRSTDFHGPGRGAGNSINALLDAHRLTGDERYLAKADALVARCVHANDNMEARNLRDVENRWSYIVFLQTLGKYLDYRVERGRVDAEYAHARNALLAYAEWMAAHERPFLDSREQLEFPTETWPAQDLRKAAVLEWAARYTKDQGRRDALLARAREFFEYATAFLVESPTGRLTRPIILLLAYAFQRPGTASGDPAGVQLPSATSEPIDFVPQRRRAVRRLAVLGALGSAAIVAAILMLVF